MKEFENQRRVISIVLYIHIVMFIVTIAIGIIAKSTAVLADAIDFAADAVSYTISIYVLHRSVNLRAYVAISKAVLMLLSCVPLLFYSIYQYHSNTLPDSEFMSISGILSIIAHIVCVYLLYKFRKGDSNLLSIWICTINDMIGNMLVIIASILVYKLESGIPDIVATFIIITLALFGACTILKQAIHELKLQ